MSQKVGRQSLYDEVWTDPVTDVARRYGLSDVGLAKLCKTMGIPLPARGYWAKVRSGAQVKRTPLPSSGRFREVASLTRYDSEQVKAKKAIERRVKETKKSLGQIPVPLEQTAQHPLVATAKQRLGRLDSTSEKRLLSAPDEVLDIEVTAGSLDRALALVNALLLGLSNLGAEVEIDREKKRTLLIFESTHFGLKVTERITRREHVETPEEKKAKERYWKSADRYGAQYPSIPRYDYFPTGQLTITAGHWPSRTWNDTGRTRLEARLAEVIAGIVALSSEIRAKEERQAREAEERRQRQLRYEQELQRWEQERALFEELEANAVRWERACRLRRYLEAVEANSGGEETAEFSEWLAWARAKADWVDPLLKAPDPLLDAPKPKRPGHWWEASE